MPYIAPVDRPRFDTNINLLITELRDQDTGLDGNANYCISRIVAGAFAPVPGSKWRYAAIARAMGCFICAALEFYRRIGAKREGEVIIQNGDITEYGCNP